jgi:CheY-like chemotaxis protein
MSHEIRTPMTAILGFTELLLGDPSRQRLSPEQREAIETIQRNGNYLLGLINDILDLSKMEAGKLEIERTECSPGQVLSEVVALMRVRARAKNLSLELALGGPVPATIRTDPLRLRQILINLVGNALKFTEVGGVRVVARLLDGPRPRLQVDVIDTGIGIGREQLARLFQPFAQADSSTTRQFGGSGLGLTISKRLAEMLHGDLTVTSVPGQGSTFRVSVATGPLEGVAMQDRLVAEGAAAPAARSSGENPVELGGRVLLAEDGPDNQRLIAHILKKAGAEVTVADNGRIAFEQALEAQQEGRPFDVVLMDMQMPEMDGYTATRALRERGYGGPIVALTAHAMSDDRQKCLDAGCDDFVSKPIHRKTLLELIAGFAAEKTRFTSPTAETDSSRRPE